MSPETAHPRRAERLIIPATFITSLGNNIQLIAAALLLVRTQHTMFAVGLLFVAVAVPQVVLSPAFGHLADRLDRRTLWVTCDLLSAAAALALPVTMVAGGPKTAVLYAVNFALAVISALFVPAGGALIKERVRASELRRFNAHYEIALQAGSLLSASIGGFAVQWFGAAPLFAFNAGTFLLSAACVYAIGRGPARTAPTADHQDVPLDVPARTLRPILLYAQGSITVTVFNALLPVFIIGELHRGSGILGLVDAIGGTGFLLAATVYRLVSRRVDDLRITVTGFTLSAITLFLQPWLGIWGLMPGVLVGAWLYGQARIASRALLMASVPEDRAGRAFGIANAAGLGGTVVAMLVVSAVTDHSDSRYGFAALAMISVLATGLSASVRTRRREVLTATG